jgi:phage host-nuclease inhibitor protein Gam
MKSVFRKAWIALIAASVLVVGACCSIRNRSDIKIVKERISDLKEELNRREQSCVYGPPEMIEEYGKRTQQMREELESLEQELQRLRKCN